MGKSLLQLKVQLDEEAEKRLEQIKKYYGLDKNAPTIRIIIKREYDRLKTEKKI
ncbi:MAG: hypothetical protein Q6356_003535 [Candidatus Wukongarchaeota archaeon]|nr:hypothetical protein [Candidatus Wukongarchaeota archaeon]